MSKTARFKWTKKSYKRRSVVDIEKFVGWPFLQHLIDKCSGIMKSRDAALIAALFETGGRVSEVLQLQNEMFLNKPNFYVVRAMPVLKRYEKLSTCKDQDGKTKFETRTSKAYRTFPIRKNDPLLPTLIDWVEQHPKNLFKITRQRAYQIVSSLDPGVWPHWFRSQRASQLAFEHGFRSEELVEFFNWKDYETALRYAHMGWEGLAKKFQ